MRILITAGPTREYLDPVRFLTNASSGKLGYAIAAAAARRGHKVELVSGPVEVKPPKGVRVTQVVTSREMFDAAVALFAKCDAAIMAAAVCDYRPARTSRRKLSRSGGLTLSLRPTRDISAYLGRTKGDRIVVGFALEDRKGRARAAEKLRRKRCDAIVLNQPSNIGVDSGAVQVMLASAQWLPPMSGTKKRIAEELISLVEALTSGVPSRRSRS